MTSAELRFSYQPEEWLDRLALGELTVHLVSSLFAGRGTAWFNGEQLKETFVSALEQYPLQENDLPLVEGGTYAKDRSGALEQCFVRVAVRPYDTRGRLLVLVDLAMENWHKSPKGRLQTVSADFFTDYNELSRFSESLKRMLDGETDEAVLRGQAIE